MPLAWTTPNPRSPDRSEDNLDHVGPSHGTSAAGRLVNTPFTGVGKFVEMTQVASSVDASRAYHNVSISMMIVSWTCLNVAANCRFNRPQLLPDFAVSHPVR